MSAILDYLNSLPGCKAVKVKGSEYTINQPDILGSLRGRMLALEEKSEGERARVAQLSVLRQWRRAGAVAGVVRTKEDVRRVLEDHGYEFGRMCWRKCFPVPLYTLCTTGRTREFLANEMMEHLVDRPMDLVTCKVLTEWAEFFPVVTDLILPNDGVATCCLLYNEPIHRETFRKGLSTSLFSLVEIGVRL